jgi:tight adherence protein B
MVLWLICLTGATLACALLAGLHWVGYRRANAEMTQRAYQLHGVAPPEKRSAIAVWAERYDYRKHGLRLQLDKANLPIRPAIYVPIRFLTVLVLYLFCAKVLALLFPLDMLLPVVGLWLGERFLFKSRSRQFSNAINKQLVEVTRLLSSGVKAGMGPTQSFELVAREIPNPAGELFARAHRQLSLGVPIDDALTDLNQRVDSSELRLLVITLLLHHDNGGNLAQALDLIATTLTEREQVHSQIESAIAEQRFVALMLPVLPLGAAVMMNLFIPGFLNPLFKPVGLIVLGIFAVLQTAALAVIRRIGRIEV